MNYQIFFSLIVSLGCCASTHTSESSQVSMYDFYMRRKEAVYNTLRRKPWGMFVEHCLEEVEKHRNYLYKKSCNWSEAELAHFLGAEQEPHMIEYSQQAVSKQQNDLEFTSLGMLQDREQLRRIKKIVREYGIKASTILYLCDNDTPDAIASFLNSIVVGANIKFLSSSCLGHAIGHELMHIIHFDLFYRRPFLTPQRTYVRRFHEYRADILACLVSPEYAYAAFKDFQQSFEPYFIDDHHPTDHERASYLARLLQKMLDAIPGSHWLLQNPSYVPTPEELQKLKK